MNFLKLLLREAFKASGLRENNVFTLAIFHKVKPSSNAIKSTNELR